MRWRLVSVSVSQVRAMDRTAQLRGKYQSACKSHGSTCICRCTRQGPCGPHSQNAQRCCSANCTGRAAAYTWSPLEPRPVTPPRRPWQKYRKPTGVISFVVPPCEIAGPSSRRPPPNATAAPAFCGLLLFDFDEVPSYHLGRLVTLRCKVRPGLRLVECQGLIHATPFGDPHALGD